MAKRIAQFHKVSFEQFKEGYSDEFGAAREEEIRKIYDAVRLPCRATSGSAGYDFYVGTGEDGQDSDRRPCGDARGLGDEVLSKERAWVQIPSAA